MQCEEIDEIEKNLRTESHIQIRVISHLEEIIIRTEIVDCVHTKKFNVANGNSREKKNHLSMCFNWCNTINVKTSSDFDLHRLLLV